MPVWLPCCDSWPSITPKTPTISSWSDWLRWVVTQTALSARSKFLAKGVLSVHELLLTLYLCLGRVWLTWAKAHWHCVPTIVTGSWWVRLLWLDCSLSWFHSLTSKTVSSFLNLLLTIYDVWFSYFSPDCTKCIEASWVNLAPYKERLIVSKSESLYANDYILK